MTLYGIYILATGFSTSKKKKQTEEKAKVVAVVWGGRNSVNSMPHYIFSTRKI